MELPGKYKERFKLQLNEPISFKKFDLMATNVDGSIRGNLVKVIKVYKFTWWKRVLSFLGFKNKWLLFTGVKVEIIK